MNAQDRIGFMQGRLSPLVDGKIQAFPWNHWRSEFPAASELGVRLMEWTLDHDRLYENPIMTEDGRREIAALGERFHLTVPSLTGDLFMQAPFYKQTGAARAELVADMRAVLEACARLGTRFVIMPLVDGGRIENDAQRDSLFDGLEQIRPFLLDKSMAVVFESDFEPARLARFIEQLDRRAFGVNLDTGNSAALGWNHSEELALYADRILNVHIKDRLLGGTTVPLGEGAADIAGTVAALEKGGYRGNYILQTARADDGDHAAAVARYRDMAASWIGA